MGTLFTQKIKRWNEQKLPLIRNTFVAKIINMWLDAVETWKKIHTYDINSQHDDNWRNFTQYSQTYLPQSYNKDKN